jgi:eukaryotic-like serine/threonine-protein kinase
MPNESNRPDEPAYPSGGAGTNIPVQSSQTDRTGLSDAELGLPDRYEILRRVGAGGMGQVYLARDLGETGLGRRQVAIKLVLDSLTNSPENHERFAREIRIAEDLEHENIVRIYTHGRSNRGVLFMVMQYVDGGSLLDRLRELASGRFEEDEAIDIGKQMCTALMVAHDRGVIHRDIKPGNVLLKREKIPSERWIAKLADFGLARSLDLPPNSGSYTAGTFGYRSPEQRKNNSVDVRSDIYSLGATLYHLLSGEMPEGPLDWGGISEGFRSIIERAMARRPEDRFQTARGFYDGLNDLDSPSREQRSAVRKKSILSELKQPTVHVTPSAPHVTPVTKPVVSRTETRESVIATKSEIAESPATEFTNSLGMQFRLIPAGKFLMGSPGNEKGRSSDELQHEVILTRPFYLGIYPVTQGEYERVMGRNPSHFKGDRHPVECVSWEDAMAYIERLNSIHEEKSLGRRYRLPTESEWEYACRAGSTSAYCFGAEESRLGDYAWYGSNSGSETHPVGKKKPNAWGLHDMHGNVWEWCSDWYGDYPGVTVTDPTGPKDGLLRVHRGGGWSGGAAYCRSSCRSWYDPSSRFLSLGFRLALSS